MMFCYNLYEMYEKQKKTSHFKKRSPYPKEREKSFSHHNKTSWESVESWYHGIVGESGHYYHQSVILPNLLNLISFQESQQPCLLDLACGQGILGRAIPSYVQYVGVDIAPSLIKNAKLQDKNPKHTYLVGDVTLPLNLKQQDFSHASIILALQNIEHPSLVFKNVAQHLRKGAHFYLVLNHPCFRIPRQSSWQVDEKNQTQFRRIDRYMSEMKIPIQTHPGQGLQSSQTLSFHTPLSKLVNALSSCGFLLKSLHEWCSDKQSTGKRAKMENRSREEIPLFIALEAIKI